MKKIRLAFTDFYGTPPENIWEYRILRRFYDVEVVTQSPDYLIDGGLGSEHLAYPNAIRLVRVGESYVPDFNQFDYAIGFDFLSFGDRYLRIPLFAYYSDFRRLAEFPRDMDAAALLAREFCSFVVSNPDGDPLRTDFFRRLSKYKPVASGGALLNNVGGRVPDKHVFLTRYKFNIAFENSVVPGYTTEKVMEPLAAQSVPIYYGNPRIADDFDPACMVRVNGRGDVERAVDEIVALDRDDTAYLAKLAAPKARHDMAHYEELLTTFLRNIFDPPRAEARRLNDYGYQTNIRRRALKAQRLYELTHPAKWLRRLRGRT